MRLGTMLGAAGQTELKKAVERGQRFEAKRDKQRRESERNKKRQRGEIIVYNKGDR